MRFGRSKRSREETKDCSGLSLLFPNGVKEELVRMLKNPLPSADYGTPVDIIAIHGLDGHPYKTWTHSKTGVFWLQDLLYKSLSKSARVRVWTYGYDASLLDNRCISSIRNVAEKLIAALETREGLAEEHDSKLAYENVQPRIIFVAHSMGGLVVKRALLDLKHEARPDYSKLFNSVHCVAFLGTPHEGSVMADYARFLLKAVKPLVRSNKAFLDALRSNSEELADLSKRFRGLQNDHIYALTITELVRTRGHSIVVTENSTRLGWDPAKEDMIGFERDHTELARYTTGEKEYIILAGKIKKMVEEAGKGIPLTEPERQMLLKKLCCNYLERMESVSAIRCKGTCEWVKDEPDLKTWYEASDSRNIWLSGDVGSGKSTVSAFFLDTYLPPGIQERSFYYFVDPKPQSRIVTTALRSLLYQILSWEECASRIVHDVLGEGLGYESLNRLGKALTKVLVHLRIPLVFLVIDGVDEYHQARSGSSDNDTKNELRDFLKIIVEISENLAPRCYIKCLFTSRPHIRDTVMDLWPDIGQKIHYTFELPREKIQKDVSRYVDSTYGELVGKHHEIFTRAQGDEKILLESIPARVKEKAGSSFLIARLSMDMCEDPLNLRSRSKLQHLVRTIGASTGKLKETYEGVLASIPEGSKEEAKRLFRWLSVVNSKQGFSLEEANSILAFTDDVERISDFAQHLQVEVEQTVKRVGASLVRVSRDGYVGWFHISAQEFLCQEEEDRRQAIEGWTFTKTQAKLEVALKCLDYLLFPDSFEDPGSLGLRCEVGSYNEDGSVKQSSEHPQATPTFPTAVQQGADSMEALELLQKYPLLSYISQHWAHHVLECQDIITNDYWSKIEKLADNPVGLITATRLAWYRKSMKYRRGFPEDPNWLHLFAYFGLTSFTKLLLDNAERRQAVLRATVAGAELIGFTPLQLAAMNGHTDLVRYLLLERFSSLRKERSPTSVELGLEFGHHDTVKVLVDEFSGSLDIPKALEMAACHGHRELIKYLLEKGADVDCKLPRYGSVMEAAAASGDESFVLFLMKMATPARVEGKHSGKYGHPLAAAAFLGFEGIVRLLVTEGHADVNLKRGKYSTALQAAAAGKQSQAIQILLDFGAQQELVTDDECRAFIVDVQKEMGPSVRKVTENTDDEIPKYRATFEPWMRHKTSSLASSARRARGQFTDTMRKIQIAIITESEFGYEYLFPIHLAFMELAVRMESRPLLCYFADEGMEILYTALAYDNISALNKLTGDLWIKALKIPIRLNKPTVVETLLSRCLSRFQVLITSDQLKAQILVSCGIEMFFAITEDGDSTLMATMARLWVGAFEAILVGENLDFEVFRPKILTQIHNYANRFRSYFKNHRYLEVGTIARTALQGLLHAFEKPCYRVVASLISIYLPILEEILQHNPSTKEYEIRWISELTSDQAQAALNDHRTQDIIKNILHIGARLYCAAFLDPNAPECLTVDSNRYRYYIATILINGLAQAQRASPDCARIVREKVVEVVWNDTSEDATEGYVAVGLLKKAYRKLLEVGREEIQRRYRGQLQEEERGVFEVVEGEIMVLLAAMPVLSPAEE